MTSPSKPRKAPTRWKNVPPHPSLSGTRRGLVEDQDIAGLLTQIIVGWPHFEDQMVSVFKRLLGLPPANFDGARLVFYSLVNQKIRIDVMRRLLERGWHNRDHSEEYDAIINEFAKLNELRNKYVHGLWWTHDNGDVHLQIDSSAFFSHAEYRKVTSKELQGFIARLNALWQQLLNL